MGQPTVQDEVSQLREALASRAVIEQAKGIVMVACRCGPDAAFDELRQMSNVHNVKLRIVAELLVSLVADQPAASQGDRLVSDVGDRWLNRVAHLPRLPAN